MGTCVQKYRIRQIERNLSNYQPPSEPINYGPQFVDKLTIYDNLMDSNALETDRSTSTKQGKSYLPLCLANLTNYSTLSVRASNDAVWKTARKPMIMLFINKTHVTIPVFDKDRAMADYERCEQNMYRALKLAQLKYPNISSSMLLQALRYPDTQEMVFSQCSEVFALLEDIEDFKELSFAKIPDTYQKCKITLPDFLVVWRMLHFWNVVQLYPYLVIFFRADADATGSCTYDSFNEQWRQAYKADLQDNVFVKGYIVTLQALVSVGERLNFCSGKSSEQM